MYANTGLWNTGLWNGIVLMMDVAEQEWKGWAALLYARVVAAGRRSFNGSSARQIPVAH